MTKLGEYAKYSKEERNEVYKGLRCIPTGNERALSLPRTQWLKANHDVRPFRRVLDFGCHDGFMHRWLLKEFSTEIIVGVEICDDACDKAVTQAYLESVDSGPIAVYLNQSWEDFHQPIRFTEVIVSEVIEHFTHAENMNLLKLAHQYLLPGGRGFVTTPHIKGPFGETNPDPHHINLMNETQVEQLILGATQTQPNIQSFGGFIYGVWTKEK